MTEVSATEAIVWTRLSHSEKSQPITHKKTKTKPKANNYYPVDFDENQPVKNMDGAIIGAKGKVRIKYKAMGETLISDWYETDSIDDFTAQIPLSKLKAGERYSIELEAMSEDGSDKSTVPGSFMAAYDAKEVKSVNLTTSTCQYFWNYDDAKRGFQTYDAMAKLKPDFSYIQEIMCIMIG